MSTGVFAENVRQALEFVEMLGPHSMLTLADIMDEFGVSMPAAKKIVGRARHLGFAVQTVHLDSGIHVYRIDTDELRRVMQIAAKRRKTR
ncbi:MAG: hypothetical protein KIT79_12740 [Deltaproteobacteria bacterium]|nr:hypothetical protein [Deltaproteobacteria bacterium]